MRTLFWSYSPPPSIGSFGINIDSQPGYAFGDINLNNLFVRARVVAVTGIGFTCHVNISATTTQIQGDYTLEPLAASPENVDVQQLGGANVVFGLVDLLGRWQKPVSDGGGDG